MPRFAAPADAPPEFAALYAAHAGRGRYFNPWRRMPTRLRDVVRWQLSRNAYDRSAPLSVPVDPGAGDAGARFDAASGPALTWIGHASFAVEDGDRVVLTDPHFGRRALVPRRLAPLGRPLSAVPPDALAVLSHNHYDHLDRWTVRHLPPGVEWFVPPGMGRWFRRAGVERVTELDWWQSATRGAWTLTALPAQHWSNRLSTGRNTTLWCSWLLDCGARRYYHAGDSGHFAGFAEIGRRWPGIDVALLPIGAYEPRWFMRYQHMDPSEAYRAFRELGARRMIGMHWGTFDLTDEPADLAPKVLAEVLAEAGGDPRVETLAIGERWKVSLQPQK